MRPANIRMFLEKVTLQIGHKKLMMNYILSWQVIHLIAGHIKIENHQRNMEAVFGIKHSQTWRNTIMKIIEGSKTLINPHACYYYIECTLPP